MKRVSEKEQVVISIRMGKDLRERLARNAAEHALPYTLYARMLLKQKLDEIEREEKIEKK